MCRKKWIPAYAGMTEYVRLLIADIFKRLIFFLDCFTLFAMTEKVEFHHFIFCMWSKVSSISSRYALLSEACRLVTGGGSAAQ
jgi:hypothetical protein